MGELIQQAGEAADRLGDFYAGLQLVLEGMLLSPNLLFVAADTEGAAGSGKLDGLSLATRLSLFLWNAAPDPNLRRAALRGDLDSDQGRARGVDMMLASPRLADGARASHPLRVVAHAAAHAAGGDAQHREVVHLQGGAGDRSTA